MVLCPLWGGVRVILHLATEFSEYFEGVANMLQQIGFMLNSLRRFPKLYPHNNHLALAMVDVYKRFLNFVPKLEKFFSTQGNEDPRKFAYPWGCKR